MRKGTKLAGLAFALFSLIAGCSKVKKEYVTTEVLRDQTPVARRFLLSETGNTVAMEVQNKNDLEVYMFDSVDDSTLNASMNPTESDFPILFAGSNLISATQNLDMTSDLRIYNANRQIAFQTDFESINWNFMCYPDDSKVVFSGDRGDGFKLYRHEFGTQNLEELVAGSTSGFPQKTSPDGRFMFVEYFVNSQGNFLSMLDTSDESLTPVLNLFGHTVNAISKNNKTALISYWTGTDMGLKTHDMPTNNVQIPVMPAGNRFQWVDALSDNGNGALVMLQDIANGDWYMNHLDIANQTFTLFKTTPSAPVNEFRVSDISPDGITGKIQDTFTDFELYHAGRDELYDPFAAMAHDESEFVGFTSDNKSVISRVNFSPFWTKEIYLHDSATKTNTQITESGYNINRSAVMLPNKQICAIDAQEIATGWDGILLKDVVNNTSQIIKQAGLSLDYVGCTPDSSKVYVTNQSDDQNLYVYDMATSNLEQITNYGENEVFSFKILEHSKDNNILLFQTYNWNSTQTVKRFNLTTKELDTVGFKS
jgi:Tol biopolymer transport system component